MKEIFQKTYKTLDRKYIDKKKFHESYKMAEDISTMLNGLMAYLNRMEYRDEKFKVKEALRKWGEYRQLQTPNSKLQTPNHP